MGCERGHGANGVVVEGEWIGKTLQWDRAQTVAVKQVRRGGEGWAEIEREIEALTKVQHKHIVDYLGTEQDGQHFYVIMELCDYNLAYAVTNQLLSDGLAASLQLLQALAHLHEQGFAHRDLKPSNVLLCQFQIKLCDFGLAKLVEHTIESNTMVGTLGWQSPEVLRKLKHRCTIPPLLSAFSTISTHQYSL